MFTYYGLEHWMPDECDADRILEFDHNEAHCHFIEFYNDVLPEFQRYGTLRQFKVRVLLCWLFKKIILHVALPIHILYCRIEFA